MAILETKRRGPAKFECLENRPIVRKFYWAVVTIKGNVDLLVLQPNTVQEQLKNPCSVVVWLYA